MRAPQNSIFICYRRNDSGDIVGRLYDRLALEFGKEAVFRDVDTIPLGVDFREHIQESLKTCRIGLIVMGPEWAGSTTGGEQLRLQQPADHVRIECETMLASAHVIKIPCYVRGAGPPSDDSLPESLKKLQFINGLEVRRDPDFNNDVEKLNRQLRRSLSEWKSLPASKSPAGATKPANQRGAPGTKRFLLVALGLALAAAALLVLFNFPQRESSNPVSKYLPPIERYSTLIPAGGLELPSVSMEEPPLRTHSNSSDGVLLTSADSKYAKKEYTEAAQDYERYLGLYPNGAARLDALYRLGEAYRNSGARNAAKNAYETLLAQFAAGDFIGPAAYRLAEIYYGGKEYRDALPLFRKASVRLMDTARANAAKFCVARCLEALGQKLDARLSYEELAGLPEKNPFQDDSRLSLALLSREAGKTADAVKQAQSLARETENPEFKAEAMVRAGLWLIDLQQRAKAETQLREALHMPGNSSFNEVAQLGSMRIQFDAGEYTSLLDRSRNPEVPLTSLTLPEVRLLVALAYWQQGHPGDARVELKAIVDRFPTSKCADDAKALLAEPFFK